MEPENVPARVDTHPGKEFDIAALWMNGHESFHVGQFGEPVRLVEAASVVASSVEREDDRSRFGRRFAGGQANERRSPLPSELTPIVEIEACLSAQAGSIVGGGSVGAGSVVASSVDVVG